MNHRRIVPALHKDTILDIRMIWSRVSNVVERSIRTIDDSYGYIAK